MCNGRYLGRFLGKVPLLGDDQFRFLNKLCLVRERRDKHSLSTHQVQLSHSVPTKTPGSRYHRLYMQEEENDLLTSTCLVSGKCQTWVYLPFPLYHAVFFAQLLFFWCFTNMEHLAFFSQTELSMRITSNTLPPPFHTHARLMGGIYESKHHPVVGTSTRSLPILSILIIKTGGDWICPAYC